MANPSVMPPQHDFSRVPGSAPIPRSGMDRSHGHKLTFNAGHLIPIFVDEALPGDDFSVQTHIYARLNTPIFPIMDNMYADIHYWAVPKRLVWDNWQKFNGEQTNPGDSTDFLIPQIVAPVGGVAAESVYDHMGIPPGVADLSFSALPLRAYELIYNEWYRDQNLQDSATIPMGDGPDDSSLYSLRRRNKRHDYFTSCLPFPQKGPAVSLPLTGDAPVLGIGKLDSAGYFSVPQSVWQSDGSNPTYTFQQDTATVGSHVIEGTGTGTGGSSLPNIRADLSAVTATTINALRQALTVQQMLELDARGGTRYTEIVRAHFGVISPDARLQRPEFLGGGSTMVGIEAIPQTSETTGSSPQGNLAAIGVLNVNGSGFTKSFTEHCIIIGLLSVRADLTYQQGLDRMWSRRTRYDFYWPTFANLGEQAVLQKEIFASGVKEEDDLVFGYQERWAEYRYKRSLITGQFRSSFPQSLDLWHLSEDFPSAPVLNDDFIQVTPPIDRVVAVPSEPDFKADVFFKYKAVRPMPMYSVPGLTRFYRMDWAAAASIGSSLISGGFSAFGGFSKNKAAKKLLRKQIAWEREKMQNKYQYQVNDLRLAGLNPALAYTNPAPLGGTPSAPQLENVFAGASDHVGRAVHTAVDTYKKSEEAKAVKTQIENVKADTKLKNEDAALKTNQAGAAYWDQILKQSQTQQVNSATALTNQEVFNRRQQFVLTSLEEHIARLQARIAGEQDKARRTWLGRQLEAARSYFDIIVGNKPGIDIPRAPRGIPKGKR